jgi:DNA primase
MMPGIDYRELRARIRLAEVLALLGYRPQRIDGQQWRGPCPLHGSARPRSRSFAAHLGKNVYHCFRCGAAGNVLDLWMAYSGQTLHAAALDLCRRLGQDVPWLPGRGTVARQERQDGGPMNDP